MTNYNKIFLQQITKLENKYSPDLLSTILAFRKAFIADYKAYGKDYALNRLQQAPAPDTLPLTIRNIYTEAGMMGAAITSRELKALANKKARGFGRNPAWIEAVNAYLKLHLLKFVQAITDTMREDIVRVLQKAVDRGISINDTVEELEREELPKARARVIARTEIVRGANVGHSVAAQDTPYEVLKKWSAAKDHRTRHSHRDINGHTVDEMATFQVPIYEGNKLIGHEEMLYPGDATASAANTCNCRCRVIYTPKTDSNGNLIMRNPQSIAPVVPMHSTPRYTPAQIAAALKANIRISVDLGD